MTAQCGGGTSGPKAGVALDALFTAASVASLFELASVPWLIPVLAVVEIGAFAMTTFCASDPPAMPAFTQPEVDDLLQFRFGTADFASGAAKMPALIANVIWDQYCHCTSGALVPFTYPTQPAGSLTPIAPVAPAVTPCVVVPFASTNCDAGNLFKGSGAVMTGRRVTSVALHHVQTTCAGGTTPTFDWVWTFKDAANATLSTLTYSLAGTTTFDSYVACPAGTAYVNLNHNRTAGTGSAQVAGSTQSFYCDDQVPGSQSPCCPPDAATQALLEATLRMVTLIQRQSVPFGYVASTAHAGLSGAGVLDISGLLGAKVAVTTLPDPLGREGTSPTEYFDMGWLTFGTADGYPSAYRLERSSQILLPARCGAYTELAYDLHPGVVVTITELVREP